MIVGVGWWGVVVGGAVGVEVCGIAGDTRVIPVDVWLVVPTVSPPMPTIHRAPHASRPIVELQDFAELGEKIVNCTAHCTYS